VTAARRATGQAAASSHRPGAVTATSHARHPRAVRFFNIVTLVRRGLTARCVLGCMHRCSMPTHAFLHLHLLKVSSMAPAAPPTVGAPAWTRMIWRGVWPAAPAQRCRPCCSGPHDRGVAVCLPACPPRRTCAARHMCAHSIVHVCACMHVASASGDDCSVKNGCCGVQTNLAPLLQRAGRGSQPHTPPCTPLEAPGSHNLQVVDCDVCARFACASTIAHCVPAPISTRMRRGGAGAGPRITISQAPTPGAHQKTVCAE
jgi:hypothetical protein